MKKSILKIGTTLTRNQQKTVHGGVGPYAVRCNSGEWIGSVPNLNADTVAWACNNQGGYSGQWICSGPGCLGIQ